MRRMRGTPTRLPYCPQQRRPIDLPPSRSSFDSWSESNDSATAQRAPSFHSEGRSVRPARTRCTSRRHSASGHCQGSRAWAAFAFVITFLLGVFRTARLDTLRRERYHGPSTPRTTPADSATPRSRLYARTARRSAHSGLHLG